MIINDSETDQGYTCQHKRYQITNSINMTMGIPFNTKKTKSMSAQK